MPSRVSRSSSIEMEQEYSRGTQSSLTTSMEDKSSHQRESGSNHVRTQMRQSPPPLIPNSGYSNQKFLPNPLCDSRGHDGSAFMMQFMTAAAAAAMASASKKCDIQTRTAEPHSSSNVYENATTSNRRPSSSLSTGPNPSPTSTSSSCRSLSGYEGGRIGSVPRSETYRSVGYSHKTASFTPDKINEDDDISMVRDEADKNSTKRPGCSLPLPPGAVPVGTLPRPHLHHAPTNRLYGLFTYKLDKHLSILAQEYFISNKPKILKILIEIY